MDTEKQAIRTVGLVKRYGAVTAVDGLDLTVREGELFALLGVNGAGKTTTVKLLTGLSRPTAGDAFVGGYSVTKEIAKVKQRIGVSPQETAVAQNLTAKENLELFAGIYGFSKERTRERIAQLSERFALGAVLGQRAGKLSGGYQRRLSIAMALLGEPQILFLDEPTLGLDVLARHALWDLIRSLRGNTTVILTTHYMEEAERLSDRIGILKNGRLLAVETAASLLQRAGTDDFEAAFVSVVEGENG